MCVGGGVRDSWWWSSKEDGQCVWGVSRGGGDKLQRSPGLSRWVEVWGEGALGGGGRGGDEAESGETIGSGAVGKEGGEERLQRSLSEDGGRGVGAGAAWAGVLRVFCMVVDVQSAKRCCSTHAE